MKTYGPQFYVYMPNVKTVKYLDCNGYIQLAVWPKNTHRTAVPEQGFYVCLFCVLNFRSKNCYLSSGFSFRFAMLFQLV